MTHALDDPEATTQLPAVPAADDQPPGADPPPADQSGGASRVVAELLAERLSGLDLRYGDLVQLVATTTADTTVVVDLTRLSVTGGEACARVVLTLSVPQRVQSAAEAGQQADEPAAESEAPAT